MLDFACVIVGSNADQKLWYLKQPRSFNYIFLHMCYRFSFYTFHQPEADEGGI